MWIGEKVCNDIIEETWAAAHRESDMTKIMNLIHWCIVGLNQWNRSYFGNVQKKLHEAKARLKGI